MKIAYFDCFSGISGDMTIAAFLDAGLKFETLSRELAKLKLKGYTLKKSRVTRGSIAGTKFDCMSTNRHCEEAEGRRSNHGHRSLKEILAIIDKSSLKSGVKERASKIFEAIAAAERKVHGAKAKDVIFHELGDIDSIIDIVGTAIALDELGVEAVYSSKIEMGRAIISSRHGNIPAPSPASLELLKGFPVSVSEIGYELVTPTGAGILKALASGSGAGPLPRIKVSAIGYGAGSRQMDERPNMLRVLIGETEGAFREDTVYVVETNIDDMNPQHFGYAIEKLLDAGALDAYITNIQMKKSRPAFKLTAIVGAEDLRKIASVIFGETSAIGLRYYEVSRMRLERESVMVKTVYGEVRAKVSSGPDGIRTASPEHDDCVRLARAKKAPLKAIYDAAKAGLLLFSVFCFLSSAHADTVIKTDSSELKGIVVEDYKDRVVFSTANGEKIIMKSDIKELYYDEEESNLIKLAEQARERRDYVKAFAYYDMAFKVNPKSKAAKDGLVFLEGYLFRQEQVRKEEEIAKREEMERQGPFVDPNKVKEQEAAEKAARLKETMGMVLVIKDGVPVVDSVAPRSPAAEAGIEKGDKLVAIWARLTGYMELSEILDALLDKPSLELKCTIDRTIDAADITGSSFAMEFDGLTVTASPEASASYAAGLRKGDLVTSIDGKSTRYMPLKDAVKMMKKAKGKNIELTIRREILMWRRD